MANITTQTVRVDLVTGKVLPVAYTHQNDTARSFVFDIYNKGVPYDMSGNTVKFAYKSPIVNGQYFVIAGSNMASGTVSGNKVTVSLPASYTIVSGVGMLTMVIAPRAGTVRPVNIKLYVQKSADGDNEIAGASDFPTTLQQIADEWYNENIAEWLDENIDAVFDGNAFIAAVDHWLDSHPEATTTVQDHSLTMEKLVVGTLGYVTPEMYGAKGDGTTDDTEAIQAALDASANHVVFDGNKTYIVSKQSNATLYPDNDAPCLFLNGKSNYVIDGNGATLKVLSHGQGVMEITESDNVVINGLTFEGYGSFPPISADGRGEKGSSTGGYYNANISWGLRKNNSVNTSAYTGIDGDTSAVWGAFGGGYICNCGTGLLIESSESVFVSNCTSTGFNYCGFSVGTLEHSDYDISRNIHFDNCVASNIYDCGFNTLLCDGVTINGCLIEDIGHPDARPVNAVTRKNYTYFDPGYGTACRKPVSSASRSKNVKVINSTVTRCARKGIDSHSADGFVVSGNVVSLCWCGGIEISADPSESNLTYNLLIKDNKIKWCGLYGAAINNYYSISQSFNPNDYEINAIIDGNILVECACNSWGILYSRTGRNVSITNNIISGAWSLADISLLSMLAVGQDDKLSEDIRIANNIISLPSGRVQYPILTYNLVNSVVANNIVNVDSCGALIGIHGSLGNQFDIIGNNFTANTQSGVAGLIASGGQVFGNTMTGSHRGMKAIRGDYSLTDGAFTITDDFFRANSCVQISTAYTTNGSLDLIYTPQPSNGKCNIYVRKGDGTLPDVSSVQINVLVINDHDT